MGSLLICSTAILAAACYAGRIGIDVDAGGDLRWQRRARIVWMLGGVALLVHAVAAFHFQHQWSHAAAWEHTRQQTLALVGWDSGHGIFANYAMTAWWLLDIIVWQRALDWPRRQRGWYWITMTVFGFLMINATAVFGPAYWWWIVGAVAVIVGAMKFAKRCRWNR